MNISYILKKIIREIKKGWCYEDWWRFRLPSLFARAIYHYLIREKNNGIYVMKEDWDNLIILDACRYDVFAENNWIKGNLKKVISRGAHTRMFLRENFNSYYPDTVYVSANPFIWECRKFFYKSIYVGSIDEIRTYGTVLPETMLKYALKANKDYPDKRLIIHFVQPHYPFIGEVHINKTGKQNINPFYLLAKGKIEESTLRRAYQSNLKRVLFVVEKLINELQGKTIITSDHGESFGSKVKIFPIRIYGHSGPRIKDLVEIPWLIIERCPRKKITMGEEKGSVMDEDKIRTHLQTLGYI